MTANMQQRKGDGRASTSHFMHSHNKRGSKHPGADASLEYGEAPDKRTRAVALWNLERLHWIITLRHLALFSKAVGRFHTRPHSGPCIVL